MAAATGKKKKKNGGRETETIYGAAFSSLYPVPFFLKEQLTLAYKDAVQCQLCALRSVWLG